MDQNYQSYNQAFIPSAVYYSSTAPPSYHVYQYAPYQFHTYGGVAPPSTEVGGIINMMPDGSPVMGVSSTGQPIDQGAAVGATVSYGQDSYHGYSYGNPTNFSQGSHTVVNSVQFEQKQEDSFDSTEMNQSHQSSPHQQVNNENQATGSYRRYGRYSQRPRGSNNETHRAGPRSGRDTYEARPKYRQNYELPQQGTPTALRQDRQPRNKGGNSSYHPRQKDGSGRYGQHKGDVELEDDEEGYSDEHRPNKDRRDRRDDFRRGRNQNGGRYNTYPDRFSKMSNTRPGNVSGQYRQRGYRSNNSRIKHQNLTDEEKEQLTGTAKKENTDIDSDLNHVSLVDKVDDLIGSRSGYQGNKSRKPHGSDSRPSRANENRKSDPSMKTVTKKVVTLGRRVDETQRESYIEQLRQGSYECMVCCCNIRCEVAVWSCNNCYHIFHLYCIKKWARSPAASMEGCDGWRCPSCQNVTQKVPNQYTCFCGKRIEPTYDRFETPHSCGEVCGRQRNSKCPHPCNILCHPGACPPCEATVNKSCDCGKTKQYIKCMNSESFHCDTVCEAELNCGKHHCKAVCHKGDCGNCEETFQQACFAGHSSRTVTCGTEEALYTSFSCGQLCDKVLDCGSHQCQKECHEGPCETCPLQPLLVTHCPCGKAELSALSDKLRESCLDPIPLCEEKCGKLLDCGPLEKRHVCERSCHEGPCGPCEGSSSRRCRCGQKEKDLPCVDANKYTDEHPLLCEKRCTKKRMCGRHKCNQPCCVIEEHICDQMCGRRLKCGLHKCEHLCHRGNCSPCLQASFDELTCHCGASVIHPPVPCGTRPPECVELCTRAHQCNHPVTHRCHSDESCPPCTVLTEKLCMGGHELRKNIPCFRQEVSCGLRCNRALPCGQHSCSKTCHKGQCLEDSEKCSQLCGVTRADCGHPCGVPCHSGSPCPVTACKTKIVIKCRCGNRSARVSCSSGGSNDISDFQRMATANLASSLSSLQSGQSVDISELAVVKRGGPRQLECDKECALLERNRRVALALEIRNPDLTSKLGSPAYSQFLKDFAKQNQQLVSNVEKQLAELVQSAKQSKQPFRRHAFPPMNMNQRKMIHELAEFYGCETESYDQEPKKNVVATANRDRCWLPSVTLTSLVQRELQPKAPLPIPHKHSETKLRDAVREMKLSTDVYVVAPKRPQPSKPVVDYFDMTD